MRGMVRRVKEEEAERGYRIKEKSEERGKRRHQQEGSARGGRWGEGCSLNARENKEPKGKNGNPLPLVLPRVGDSEKKVLAGDT